MDRFAKISKLLELKALIQAEEERIEEEQQKLASLKKKKLKEEKSQLPILLFLVDETLPMPDNYYDWKYEYVYFLPDLNEIRFVMERDTKTFLPGTIDLRRAFTDSGIPTRIWPSNVKISYYKEVDKVVSILKNYIDAIFFNNNIESWSMLATYISPEKIQNAREKVKK